VRALVTNDDGIGSEGLRWLASTAVAAGLEVVVAAPLHDSSGTSASLTAVERDGRVVVEERTLPDLPDVRAYGVAAAPGFIALIATRGAFGPAPDVVLSGINRGPNVGNAVLHSGTVGAAMTARIHGARALAVSLGEGDAAHWSTAAGVAGRVLERVLSSSDAVVFNLNVPNAPPDDILGVRDAHLATFGAVQAGIVDSGKGWVRLGVVDPSEPPEDGSDAAVLASGYASVTPLRPLCAALDLVAAAGG
jgi:5'-nucleotidase